MVAELLGTVRADGSLELMEKVALPPGKVRVRVEPVPPLEPLAEFQKRTRRELEAAGHKFMDDDEVAAWIEDQRDGGEDRLEEAYRQAEEKSC